jgi:hypothetical protein
MLRQSRRSISSKSVTSSKHTAVSERTIQQRAKLAALEETKKFAAKEAEMERLRLESEQQSRNLEMEKEMAVARAQLSVYESYEDGEMGESIAPAMVLSSEYVRVQSQLSSSVVTDSYLSQPAVVSSSDGPPVASHTLSLPSSLPAPQSAGSGDVAYLLTALAGSRPTECQAVRYGGSSPSAADLVTCSAYHRWYLPSTLLRHHQL